MPAAAAAAAAALRGRRRRGLGLRLHRAGRVPQHGGRAERAQETERRRGRQVPPEEQPQALRAARPGEGQLAVAAAPRAARSACAAAAPLPHRFGVVGFPFSSERLLGCFVT